MSKAVDYRETLVTYLRSNSGQEAAATLGVSYPTLASRLKAMKKAGVEIPRLSRKTGGLGAFEVAQLNSLVKKYQKENS